MTGVNWMHEVGNEKSVLWDNLKGWGGEGGEGGSEWGGHMYSCG